MASRTECSLGAFLKDNACQPTDSASFHCDLSHDHKEILKLRTGCPEVSYVCESHWLKFFELYSAKQMFCTDPFAIHKKKVTKSLRVITIDLTRRHRGLQLIPGRKLCRTCRSKVSEHKATSAIASEPASSETSSSEGL